MNHLRKFPFTHTFQNLFQNKRHNLSCETLTKNTLKVGTPPKLNRLQKHFQVNFASNFFYFKSPFVEIKIFVSKYGSLDTNCSWQSGCFVNKNSPVYVFTLKLLTMEANNNVSAVNCLDFNSIFPPSYYLFF